MVTLFYLGMIVKAAMIFYRLIVLTLLVRLIVGIVSGGSNVQQTD